MFAQSRRTAVCTLESPAYTAATLSSVDFNVRVEEDISYSPEIEEKRRRVMQGDFDFDTSVMGKQRCTASFSVYVSPGSATDATVIPAWSKLLQACGMKPIGWDNGSEVAVGSAVEGISWEPHIDYTHVPITLELEEIKEGASSNRLITRIAGAMGNVKFSIGTVGEPIMMHFEFSGRLESIADRAYASRMTPNGLSTVVPPAVLTTTVVINSVAQDLDKFEVDMGNDVQEWVDPVQATGVKGNYITMKEPIFTVDPTSKLLADEAVYTDWLAGTARAISVTTSGTVPITLSATKAQHTAVANGERNGAVTAEKTLLLTRGATANKTFQILQGATT